MAITAAERAELDQLANLPAKVGPAQRAARGVGQGAIGYALVDVAKAFDWFGSEHWSSEQAADRWPAVTTVVVICAGTAHNVLPAVGRWLAAWWARRYPTG